MAKNQKNDEKVCWACKRVIVEEARLGLCPECLNKYGSPVAAIGVLGIGIGAKVLVKNSGKIFKAVKKIIK